jgi:uncharacterized protein
MPSSPRPPPTGAGLRFPALAWALLHVPLFLYLYAPSLGPALESVPPGFRASMWPALVVEAMTLALVSFALALPLSPWGRAYRLAAPFATGLATAALAVDARLFGTVGFHVNGFFFKVLAQPAALRETGVSSAEVARMALQAAAWIAAETLVGALVLPRLAGRRPAWRWAALLLLLGAAERTYVASLTFFGGQAVFAAGQVFPLQVPVRMNDFWSRLTGRPTLGNPLRAVSRASAGKLPPGVDPAAVHFERRPDVLLLVLESLREDYLRPDNMPRLLARAATQGTIFERHQTSAPTTASRVWALRPKSRL